MDKQLNITVPHRLDLATGHDIAARVRSGLRNGLINIVFHFAPNAALCSSEFLGWLVSCARHVKAQGGTITLRGISADNRRIFSVTHLDECITIEDVTSSGTGG
jgi:anti-anti-sigma regulatory factor